MKNKLKLFGIIAIIAVIAFTMTACDDDPEDITITITGIDGSKWNGWEMVLGLGSDSTAVAVALPLTVTANTTSLEFTMLDSKSSKITPFNAAGTYMVVLWFEKDGEEDVDYYIASRKINEGANSIPFGNFSLK